MKMPLNCVRVGKTVRGIWILALSKKRNTAFYDFRVYRVTYNAWLWGNLFQWPHFNVWSSAHQIKIFWSMFISFHNASLWGHPDFSLEWVNIISSVKLACFYSTDWDSHKYCLCSFSTRKLRTESMSPSKQGNKLLTAYFFYDVHTPYFSFPYFPFNWLPPLL